MADYVQYSGGHIQKSTREDTRNSRVFENSAVRRITALVFEKSADRKITALVFRNNAVRKITAL